MTSLTVEHLGIPSSARGVRAFSADNDRALDTLGGRVVWCAGTLGECLERIGVAVARLEHVPGEAEALLECGVRRDDVVVLAAGSAVDLAEPLRDAGAHVVGRIRPPATIDWHTRPVDAYVVTLPPERTGRVPAEEIAALMPSPDAVSAKEVERVPAALLALRDAAWSRLLADVITRDRKERVGGTHHPRPSVAVR
jgi:hypothetical protein